MTCAAEIAETYPEKKVTLIQSHQELVPGYSARMSRRILSILRGLKVEVGKQVTYALRLTTRVLHETLLPPVSKGPSTEIKNLLPQQ